MKRIATPVRLENPGPEVLVRLVNRIRIGRTGCWNWQGHKDVLGYGQMKIKGRAQWAHRVAYACFYGEAPEGLCLDHACHNPSCVRPDHLRPMTLGENTARSNRHRNGKNENVPF